MADQNKIYIQESQLVLKNNLVYNCSLLTHTPNIISICKRDRNKVYIAVASITQKLDYN